MSFLSNHKKIFILLLIIAVLILAFFVFNKNYLTIGNFSHKSDIKKSDTINYKVSVFLKKEYNQYRLNELLSYLKSNPENKVVYISKDNPAYRKLVSNQGDKTFIPEIISVETTNIREKNKIIEFINKKFGDIVLRQS